MTDPVETRANDTPIALPGDSSPLFRVSGVDLLSPLSVVLVRHGVTDMTVTRQLSGSGVPGPALNAAGRVQAAKAADAVHAIGRRDWPSVATATRVIASPLVRTQETAAAIGRRLGVHPETEDRLREIHFGSWEGRTAEEISADDAHIMHRWRFGEIPAEGGESFGDVGERMDSLLVDLAREHARAATAQKDEPRTWVAVSHAVAIKCAVGASMGMPVNRWGAIWPVPASVTMLQLRVSTTGEIVERHLMSVGAPTD
ncbi:histidine phosphatase family protein [Demequina sp.]|uniref:histidine phosphatase family protein n=1 Tax=Demequina sp. TaxID=2050685 RepID=UPI0025BD97B7|nr:histidine phosphatase family protein [Demequina sp.]